MKGLHLFAITGYICLLWCAGLIVTRKSRSSEAYLVASRGLSVPFVSVLVAGTWIGGVSIVGMAQGSFIHGISALWFQVGIWIAMFVTAYSLPRILADRTTYSILDVVGSLYDKKTTRLAGIFQLFFSIWVVTMQIVGGGAILSVLLRGQVTYGQGMVLTAAVFTGYNAMGGFVATAYTNLIHIVAIFVGLFAGGAYIFFTTDSLAAMARVPHSFSPFGDLGVTQALSWAFINFTLGVLAQPVINTASSAVDMKSGKRGIIIGNLLAIPVVIIAALCGIAAKDLFPHVPSIAALPVLLSLTPPIISVFFLIAMWAPLMSSGSPFLMGATTLAVKGYLAPALKLQGDRKLLALSRLTTIAIGLVSLLLAFFVREILREVTWIAVLLSAIVFIVFLGWGGKGIGSRFAFTSLLGTVIILILSFVTGMFRFLHPIWPVTIFVALVMGTGFFVTKKRKD